MFRRFLSLLTLLLLCALPALAEAPLPEVHAALDQYEFSAPGPVDVTITVTNTTGAGMLPCALYDPDGRLIHDFGTPSLAAGETRTWTGTWNVTQERLDAGQIVFALRCVFQRDDGTQDAKTQSFSIAIRHQPEGVPLPEDLCGTWTILYAIEDGVAVPAAERPSDAGYALVISPEAIRVLWRDAEPTLWAEDPVLCDSVIMAGTYPRFTGTIVAPGLMTVDEGVCTLVLQRNAPDPWESPFAGDWRMLLIADESSVRRPDAIGEDVVFRFTQDAMAVIHPDGTRTPCLVQYRGSTCFIFGDDAQICAATIDGNRLLTLYTTGQSAQTILLIPADPE